MFTLILFVFNELCVYICKNDIIILFKLTKSNIMAEELSLDSIKDMKKADFIKAFKNKAAWKKAKAVIFLVDYKLEGKKAVIAIPFKKENEMKLEMKRLKKEKLHLLKKSGGGTLEIVVGADGEREAKIELMIGGLKPELLQLKASPLFERIKLRIQATQNEDAKADAAASEGEVDENEDLPEDTLDDVAVEDSSDDSDEKENSTESDSENSNNPKKEKIRAAVNTIKENANKLKAAIGKIAQDKIKANADKLKAALEKILSEAKEFIDDVEQEAKELLDDVKNIISEVVNPSESKESSESIDFDRNKIKNYADQGKTLADEFKRLKATIKKNLEDLQSEREDVDMVNAMIEKVQKHEDIFDGMSPEEQEKVQKMRDTIKSKITPELEKMMEDVLRYLDVRDRISDSRARDQQGVRDNIQDLRSRLERLKASLTN